MSDKIEQLVSEYNKMKEEFQKKAQAAFKEVFKEFWEQHPNVKAVVWHQYTPYFNDGEPCYFGVGELSGLSQVSYDQWVEDGGWAEEYGLSPYNKPTEEDNITEEEVKSAYEALNQLQKLPDDIYLDMFGDHVQIIATPSGFEVEEFSHD